MISKTKLNDTFAVNEIPIDQHKLGENLSYLMDIHHISVNQLSTNTNIPVTTIKRIKTEENTNPTINSLLPIAHFFSITINELLGIDPLPDDIKIKSYNENQQFWTKIIIIKWEQVNSWLTDQFSIDANSSTISTDIHVSKKSFALTIEDDNFPGFMKDMKIIIDPSKEPVNNSYVLAIKKNQLTPNLYRLLIHNNHHYLMPLDPELKISELDEEWNLIGTLVQGRIDVY